MKVAIARLTSGAPEFYTREVGLVCDTHMRAHVTESSEVLLAIARDRRSLAFYGGLIWRIATKGEEVVLVAGKRLAKIANGTGDQAWIAAALACPHFFKREHDDFEIERALVFRDAPALAENVDVLKARSERYISSSISIRARAAGDGVWLESYDKCACCGRSVPYLIMQEIGGSRYCKACVDAHHVGACCCGCGSAVLESHDARTADGYACATCINGAMDNCVVCNDLTSHTDDDGQYICTDCYAHSVRCEDCEAYVHSDDAQYDGGAAYCQECYDHLMQDRDNLVNAYSYKPEPIYHGSGLQLGLELEASFTDPDDRSGAILAISEEIPEEIAYLKKDGSLLNGVEIVSHPHDLESWHDRALKYYDDAIWRFSDFAIWGRDGIHIHVDRHDMTVPHQIRFALFFTILQEQMSTIADRRSSWAVYDDRPTCGHEYFRLIDRGDRYRATNFNNRNTVEVRIFRSTLHISKVAAYLECVDAIYHFTQRSLRKDLESEDVWKNFCKYLKYQEKYNNISNLIKELGL